MQLPPLAFPCKQFETKNFVCKLGRDLPNVLTPLWADGQTCCVRVALTPLAAVLRLKGAERRRTAPASNFYLVGFRPQWHSECTCQG
eukprot:2819481-Amphidinium_carterae.1